MNKYRITYPNNKEVREYKSRTTKLKDNNNGTSTDSLYYIFKDHLGSYDRITNQLGQTVEIYSFDAWGNRRKADNWTIKDLSTVKLFNRGFTGHEHLDAFDVINMNGRLYDPVIARFLSPDPYVQMPNNTQNFNRYSYCLNNPLLYTDPSGEIFLIDDILIGAAVGCIVNFWIQGFSGNINGTGDALAAMGIGALSGAAGALAGGAIAGVIGSTGFISGAGVGAAGAGASGFVLSGGNAWSNGASFIDGLKAGGLGALTGILAGGLTGGIVAGIKAVDAGTNFWTAKGDFDLKGAYACSSKGNPVKIATDYMKIRGAKYVGQIAGTNVYESDLLGTFTSGNYQGVTLPPKGIFVGEGVYSKDWDMMRHEFGHVLQYKNIGFVKYYGVLAPASLSSATNNLNNHNLFWTETWANYLSYNYFNQPSNWNFSYPIQNISLDHWNQIQNFNIPRFIGILPLPF